jgi:cyclopropane fatty-acyl-phospholipid synthase-like methyltransferase
LRTDVDKLRKGWNRRAKDNPFYYILTKPEFVHSPDAEIFFRSGEKEISELLSSVDTLGLKLGKKTALDFGCGVGRLTLALAKYFDGCVGVDVSDQMITFARGFNKFPNKVTYLLNLEPDLSVFETSTFDFVVSLGVLQHIPPELQRRYIADFARILRPGGVAVFNAWGEIVKVGLAPFMLRLGVFAQYAIPSREVRQIVEPLDCTVMKISRSLPRGSSDVRARIWAILANKRANYLYVLRKEV